MKLETALTWIPLITVVAFWFGRYRLRQELLHDDQDLAKRRHEAAVGHFNKGELIRALSLALEASSKCANESSSILLGAIYEALKEDELALRCYEEASMLARRAKKGNLPHFYLLEAKVHLRMGDWEFAHLRSNTAVEMIESEDFLDSGELLADLRVARMISALRFFTGKKAIEEASKDAEWVLKNSQNGMFRDIANGVKCGQDVVASAEECFLKRN